MIDTDEINHLRSLARACADSPRVSAYVSTMAKNLFSLYSFLYGKEGEKMLLTHLGASESPRTVPKENILPALEQGNLREQMSLLVRIIMGPGCELYTLLMRKYLQSETFPSFLTTNPLESHIQDLESIFGVDRAEILSMTPCGTTFPCAPFFSPPMSSALYIAEYARPPWMGPARVKRENPNGLKPTRNAIYPTLSDREAKKIRPSNLNSLPWVTGYQYWKPKPDSFVVCLLNYYNELSIAGPSGSTDMILNLFSLFQGFDVRLTALACIGWMGMYPDHSCAEILLAARPYGLTYGLSKQVSSLQFAASLLDLVNQPEGTPRIGGASQTRTRKQKRKL